MTKRLTLKKKIKTLYKSQNAVQNFYDKQKEITLYSKTDINTNNEIKQQHNKEIHQYESINNITPQEKAIN